jgi:hypothetical protein
VQTLRRHLPIIITAVLTATVFSAAPTVARAAYDAVNSDKVDGKHAVGAGASAASRAGKLVATNSSGRLPNNIIDKAPDSNALDGRDSTEFLLATDPASDSDLLDGLDSTDFLTADGKAADADRLDGLSSSAFLGAGGTAADAELLDGLDSAQFDRPVLYGVESVSATLAEGGNFALGNTFTPTRTGMCLVMVSGQIYYGPTEGTGPTLAIAGKRGTDEPFRAMYYDHYFVGHSLATPDMTTSAIVRIDKGEPTQLGAHVGEVGGGWVGKTFRGHLTYTCTTWGLSQ